MSEQVRRIGYIRTSPTDHHPNTQADVLLQAGCSELVGADSAINQQQALKEILDLLGNGDTLLVYRIDRLARDEQSVTNFQQQLESMGVQLVTTDEQQAAGDGHA